MRMQFTQLILASTFIGSATTQMSSFTDLVGSECSSKLLPDGFCCCELQEAGQSPSGIVVQARKKGEPDPLVEDACDSDTSASRSPSQSTRSPSPSPSTRSPSPSQSTRSAAPMCGAPKKIENWCADTACNKSITCEEGKSCMSDFRIFGGCTCNPYCALTGSCCRECRLQCEKAAKQQNLAAVANSCASTCVGTPSGSNCSCAPFCVASNTCCPDFQTHCAKKLTQFYNSLNKERGDAITENDLSFAVGRMLLSRKRSIATDQATRDGKVVANCLLEIAKGLRIGKVADPRNHQTRTLDKNDIDVLCKATPLDSGNKERSLSVEDYEFLNHFCRLQDSRESDASVSNLKVKKQVSLCRIGEEVASNTCSAIELASATLIVGGEPNADVVARDTLKKKRSQVQEVKEMHTKVLEDAKECSFAEHPSDQEKVKNAEALQDVKKIKVVGTKPLQSAAIQSFQELHEFAAKAQHILREKLEKIASQDQDRALEAKVPGVKTQTRAMDKAAVDYKCNWRHITDICRGTLRTTCSNSCKMGAIRDAFDKVTEVFEWKLLKNSWANPHGNAYADLNGLVAVRLDNGIDVICELQIQVYDVEVAKSREELAMHEVKSQILRGANNEFEEKKLLKNPKVRELTKQAFKMHQTIWNKCFGLQPYKGTDQTKIIKPP